jgi:hypothetical protein
MVLERLQGNKRVWNKVNQLERDFSVNYVKEIRLGYTPGGQL